MTLVVDRSCIRALSPPAMRFQMAAKRCRVRKCDGVSQTLLCRSRADPSSAFPSNMAARRRRFRMSDGVIQTLLRRSSAGPSPAFPLDLAATQYCEDECPLPGQSLAIRSRSAARRRRISLDDISGRSLGIQPRSAARRRRDAHQDFSVRSLGIQPRLAANRCRGPRCRVTTRFPLKHLLDWLVCWALWLSRQ